MKKLTKVMLLLCSVILTLSVVGVVGAQAASAKPKLNKTSRTIYVGGSSVNPSYADGTYILKVTNRPSKYTISWASSDSSVVKVSKYGSSKYKSILTAVAPGKANVTATVIDTSTSPNTMYSLTCKVTVKKNCSALEVSGAPTGSLNAGEKVQLSATMFNAAGAVAAKGEITDTVKWASSNTAVATVDATGLVSAAANLTSVQQVDIYCYTVQASSGTYSTRDKATATKKVSLTVEPTNVKCMKSVVQKTLASFDINFVNNYSKVLTKDNVIVSLGNASLPVKSVAFDSTGLVATVTMFGDLPQGSNLTVAVSGTGATADTSMMFVTSSGNPVRMELYTELGDNRVVARKAFPIKFRLIDSNGIDVTPLDEKSSAYSNAASKITFDVKGSSSGLITDGKLFIYDVNKTVEVEATYKDYNITTYSEVKFTASMTAYSVSEASTLTFDKAMVTDSTLAGSKLDWTNAKLALSESDKDGTYKIVVRLKDYAGNYVYSTDSNTSISFEDATANSQVLGTLFNGTLIPLKQGTSTVNIKYDGVNIKSINVTVNPPRVATTSTVTRNGVKVEASNTVLSKAISEVARFDLKIFDQMGDMIKLVGVSSAANIVPNVKIELATSELGAFSNAVVYANPDGSAYIELSADYLFNATQGGTTYAYLVKYNDGTKDLTVGSFSLVAKIPNYNAPMTYLAELSGPKDMTVTSMMTALPALDLNLYVCYGGTKTNKVSTVYSSENACPVGDYFYVLQTGGKTVTAGLENNKINIVRESGGVIEKFAPGAYNLVVYKKTASGKEPACNPINFTLTDSQTKVTLEKLDNTGDYITTRETLTKDTPDSTLIEVFNSLFKVVGEKGEQLQVYSIESDKYGSAVNIRSVTVTENVIIGDSSKTMRYKVDVNALVRQIS